MERQNQLCTELCVDNRQGGHCCTVACGPNSQEETEEAEKVICWPHSRIVSICHRVKNTQKETESTFDTR